MKATEHPEIIQVGTVYYARLPGDLCLRVDWNGKADFVEDMPVGEKVKPYPCIDEPPRPVREQIHLANQVAKRVRDNALQAELARFREIIGQQPKNESIFVKKIKAFFGKSAS